MDNKAFTVRKGPQGGDCTGPYYITIIGKPTLKDCIEQVVSSKGEWGYIGIDDDQHSIFGDPKLSYSCGDISNDGITDEYLNRIVVAGSGSGGWSRSDFKFKLMETTHEN